MVNNHLNQHDFGRMLASEPPKAEEVGYQHREIGLATIQSLQGSLRVSAE